MNVLVVGSGAREHALAWKLRQSKRVEDVFIAPGSGGTGDVATNLAVPVNDFEGIARAAKEHGCGLVVVGPEDPLAAGLVDFLTERGIAAYGPTKDSARIESSKIFSKELMERAGIPRAGARHFSDAGAARAYLEDLGDRPVVVKADGLAAGKGVIMCNTLDQALQAVDIMMVRRDFGVAGDRVLIEERLAGPELSAHAFCDGRTTVPMPLAKDHKRLLDGDIGPNTGGMGAISPPAATDPGFAASVHRQVVEPVVAAMNASGTPYRGTLFPGLMLTREGLKVLEFNCRFGDPETQVLLPRLQSDLFEVLWATVNGRLDAIKVAWSERTAVGVVMASGGYPATYRVGFTVDGLEDVDEDVLVFHAGTKEFEGRVVTNGGRVLTVVGLGETLEEARRRAYDNVRRIRFQDAHYRTDIGAI
jgi:phosphoribosylamine--glycine ligase